MFASRNNNQAKEPDGRRPERGDSTPDRKTSSEENPVWRSLAMRSGALQPKLTISQADDPYEREADRVAEQVMRMPVPQSDGHGLSITPVTSRQAQRKCAECEEEEGKLQRKESGSAEAPATASPIIDQALSSPGQPLDAATRAYFEPRFGSDFSEVRVHTDAQAAESARAVNALAYTTGRDVFFGTRRYEPRTRDGLRLLAHELAHVAQQSRSDRVRHGYGNEQRSWSPISLRNAPNRVYRQPTPLEMTTEAEVALVFDRLATTSKVQVATEVNIAVQDEAGNWILGRIDRIVKLPDGRIIGIELKLDATSPKTPAQTRYIPLANEGSIIVITGHAADQLNLPQGTRITLRILIVSSENVGRAMEMLGIKPESLPRVIRRPAGSRPPPQPSGFESAPESAGQVPRSPRAVRLTSETPPPGAAAGSGAAPAASGRRVPAYSATPEGSSAARGSVTAAGEAMPVLSQPPGGSTVGSPGKELQELATTRPLEPAVHSAPREQPPHGAQSGGKPAGSGANQSAAGRPLSGAAGAAAGLGGAIVVESAAREWANYVTSLETEEAQQSVAAFMPDISRELEKNREMGVIIMVSFSQPLQPGYPATFLGASPTLVSGLTLAEARESYRRQVGLLAEPTCNEIITRNYWWVPPLNSAETEAHWSEPDLCESPWIDGLMQWWEQLWERLTPGMFREG